MQNNIEKLIFKITSNTDSETSFIDILIHIRPSYVDQSLIFLFDVFFYPVILFNPIRYYVLGMLIVYSYLKKFFTRTIEPLEPVFEQVRKVPKKDVSAEGIFYQVLRLQFLVLLFVSPYIASAFHYLAQPLVWAKDWMFAAVDIDSSSYKKSE